MCMNRVEWVGFPRGGKTLPREPREDWVGRAGKGIIFIFNMVFIVIISLCLLLHLDIDNIAHLSMH